MDVSVEIKHWRLSSVVVVVVVVLLFWLFWSATTIKAQYIQLPNVANPIHTNSIWTPNYKKKFVYNHTTIVDQKFV